MTMAFSLSNEILSYLRASPFSPRFYGKGTRRPRETGTDKAPERPQEQPKEETSFSDQLLNQGGQPAEPKKE